MKKLLTILVLIMLIISFFQITSMYALYKEEIESEYNTLLGVWKIKVNSKDITTSGQIEKFTIADTQLGYIESEYIQAETIAPSGKAYFDIVIDPADTDVSVIYQIDMESIDIPNAQIELLSVDNYFKKDEESDVINTQVSQDGNRYTAVIPVDKIVEGYQNHLKVNFKWVNEDTNNTSDTVLANYMNATNKNITWTSSDETVATVSNGVITALSNGTATITVTTADGSYTDTCTVTVTEDVAEAVPVTSVVLDKQQVTLKKGETEMLLPTVYTKDATNKNITWTSSNETIATVSNGVINAISQGTAIITATTVNGSHTRTCTVTVTEDEVDKVLQATEVCLNKTEVVLKTGQTEVLVPTIYSEHQKFSIPLQINLKQYTGEVIGQ